MKAPLYIHACEMLTPIGLNRATSAAAQSAGISNFQASTYLNSAELPVFMALAPESALPEPDPFLELLAELSPWEYHLLRLAHLPLAAAWPQNHTKALPVLLILPELHPRGSAGVPPEFIRLLAQQTQLPLCTEHSQLLPYGRAGLGLALDEALRILQQGAVPYVLVGGVDSYQQERLLSNLDADSRLATPDGPSDSFIPAEGAAWLCLSLAPSQTAVALSDWSLGEEPGHLYSQAPYTGESLAKAYQQLASGLPKFFRRMYSTANGERYWAKELGVMMTRAFTNLPEPLPHVHPADCWGDLGAASGPALIALAVSHFEKNPSAFPALISCASDQGLRALAVLETLKV